MTTDQVYDAKSIYYHWISAALILLLWLIGQNIDSFDRGDPRVIVRSIHITLGLLLAVVFALRVSWKFTGAKKLPQAVTGIQGKLATGTHHLLYLLLGVTLLIGIAAVWVRGDNIFNLFKIPAFDPTSEDLPDDVVDLHELLANSLLLLAGAHTLLAIWHQRVIKDNLLKRMWPSLKQED